MLMNTPDAFTPDGRWLMGEAPEIGNYYVCAGMNGNSLQVHYTSETYFTVHWQGSSAIWVGAAYLSFLKGGGGPNIAL